MIRLKCTVVALMIFIVSGVVMLPVRAVEYHVTVTLYKDSQLLWTHTFTIEAPESPIVIEVPLTLYEMIVDWFGTDTFATPFTQVIPTPEATYTLEVTSDPPLTVKLYPIPLPTAINIDPDILKLRSKGWWITAYIQLPEEYNPQNIDAATILLDATIQPVLDPKYDFVTNSNAYLVDHNEDGILERMVKFDRAEVMALLSVGEAALTVTGKVSGIAFEGYDTIRVIDK